MIAWRYCCSRRCRVEAVQPQRSTCTAVTVPVIDPLLTSFSSRGKREAKQSQVHYTCTPGTLHGRLPQATAVRSAWGEGAVPKSALSISTASDRATVQLRTQPCDHAQGNYTSADNNDEVWSEGEVRFAVRCCQGGVDLSGMDTRVNGSFLLSRHLQPGCAADAFPQRWVAHELLRQADRRLVVAGRVQKPCSWVTVC